MIDNIDDKIIILINKLYNMDQEQIRNFKIMLENFSYEEKIEISYSLWKKIKEEESIISKFLKKIKLLKNDLEEYKVKKDADKLLANI